MLPTPQPQYEVYKGCTPQRFASDFLNRSPVTLQAFCMKERIPPDRLPTLIEEVLIDWELAEQTHLSRKEALTHLINHIRIKIRNEQRNNTPRQGEIIPRQNPRGSVGIEDVASAILRRVGADKGNRPSD